MKRALTTAAIALGLVFSAQAQQAPADTSPAHPDKQEEASGINELYGLALPEESSERLRLLADIENALSAKDRPLEHKIRDDMREVRPILAIARPKAGDRVLDIGSGGGYLATIFSYIVGEGGHVDIHNTPGWIAQFPGMDPDRQKQALPPNNFGWITTRWDDLPSRRNAYDIVVMGQVYHDAVLEGADINRMNREIYRALKPGGRFVIEDHAADPNMALGQQVGLHRISVNAVMEQVTAAGFTLAGSLAVVSADDDPRRNVFTPGIRGRTERFILAFEKPSD